MAHHRPYCGVRVGQAANPGPSSLDMAELDDVGMEEEWEPAQSLSPWDDAHDGDIWNRLYTDD
eukprot:7133740-Karenia_brevis.AAC.1